MFLLVWSYGELLRTGQRVHRPPLIVFDDFQCAISRAILHGFGVDLQCWPLGIGNKQWKQAMLGSLGLGWISTFYHTTAKPAGGKSQGKVTPSRVDAEWQLPIPTVKHARRKHRTYNGQTTTSSSVQHSSSTEVDPHTKVHDTSQLPEIDLGQWMAKNDIHGLTSSGNQSECTEYAPFSVASRRKEKMLLVRY